jgi:eukaryotic-like serine/threonine-protein kinase
MPRGEREGNPKPVRGPTPRIRVRQHLGKYRVERRIATGGFADVYEAYDTIEGIRVALKIPHGEFIKPSTLNSFRHEARTTARLEHPNILSLKTAGFIDDRFVVVYALGVETLDERLRRRMALRTALDYAEQLLEGAAFAHEHRIIHCDIKPGNCILFDGDQLRLADFGIAKVALKTLTAASGAGTVGYMAPEQAMGKPSFRSDVFSIGLILYEMLAGELPEWPYAWPLPGYARLRTKVSAEMITLLRRSLEVDARKRYRDASSMLEAFRKARGSTLKQARRRARAAEPRSLKRKWKSLREREFRRHYRKTFGELSACGRCRHPVGETMNSCPWCGFRPKIYRGPTTFPARCKRCGRGMKLDWAYCAWCYGPGYEHDTTRRYSDVRYSARCGNPECERKEQMPFMRYCPWCRTKVKRKWKIPDSEDKCPRCQWGVLKEFWTACPWCGKSLKK